MSRIMLISPKDNNFYNFRSELILKLLDKGHEVILNCPYGKKIDYFTQKGCRFIDITIDRRGKNIKSDLKLINTYKTILGDENPDIVLTYTSKPSIYGGYVCGKLKIPYIVNNAGLMDTKGLFDILMKFLYWFGWRNASCIMYQNSYERDIINKLFRNKVHYRDIPGSGVNLDLFQYSAYPPDDNLIVFNYVGRIVSLKGIDEFLECAIRVKKRYQNTEFIIYGEYDDESYRNKIDNLEKKGVVKYGGVQLDMKPCIEAAHAVIHPSHYEGMTNVVLEHSAMGRVCIGANIPGVREGIEDNVTGFLFQVNNIDSMVDAVVKFIELPYKKKVAMGSAARKKMEREFDRNIVTKIYLMEINKILNSKGYLENK